MRQSTIVPLILAAAAASAQTSSLPPQAAGAVSPAYTIRSGTQRVLVDVIVKDKNGHPVHGLKSSDFSVFEDGVPQTIREFDEHTGLTAAEAAAVPRRPALAPGEFTNFVPTPPNAAVNIILLDMLNTAQSDQQYVRQQVVQYLKHARPDSRTAIFGLTTHLILLQGFSSDPALLLKALNYKDDPKASPLREDTLGNNAGVEGTSELQNVLIRGGMPTLANIQAFQATTTAFMQQMASQYTLDALNQIGRSMVNVPGRKNLIWFTGNFPSGLFPGDNDTNIPYGQFAGLEDEFRDTVNLLAGNQIAIYPVDAQGLRSLNNNNASQANPQYGSQETQITRLPQGGAPSSGGQLARGGALGLTQSVDLTRESTGIANEHLGMVQIARDTGGEAFYNSSDLTRAVEEAVSSGSNYYTIAYSPGDPAKQSSFRSISVKTREGGYKLSYRRGYYAGVPGSKTASAGGAGTSSPSSLRAALTQGAPEPTEILLKVRAAPVSLQDEATVAAGNQPNPDSSRIRPPFRTFRIDYAASMNSVLVRHTSDNLYHVDVDFVTYVYDTHGTLINAQSNTVRTNYTAAQLAASLRSGLPFSQQISVPRSGEHILRIAVHDNIGDKVGAIEIPVGAIAGLQVNAGTARLTGSEPPAKP